jgi:hypothetical protein
VTASTLIVADGSDTSGRSGATKMRHRLLAADVIGGHVKLEVPLTEAKRKSHPLLNGERLDVPALLFS